MKAPANLTAEAAVLGAVLLDSKVLADLGGLSPADFHAPAHAAVFRAMLALHERRETIDVVTLEQALKSADELRMVGGLQGISALSDATYTTHGVQAHARLVADAARLRRLSQVAREIADGACSDPESVEHFCDEAERKLLTASRTGVGGRYILARDLVHPTMTEIVERARRKNPITGVATRFADLDRLTCGLHPGQVVILAARPSMGKTALALNIAQNLTLPPAGHVPTPVLFFSLEMSNRELLERLLCGEARVDSQKLRAGQLIESELARILRAAQAIHKSPLAIDDTASHPLPDMRACARRWRSDRTIFPNGDELGLIVVDYLQLARGSKEHSVREQEVAEISRGLKALAKELSVPVLCLAQLNRGVEGRGDKRPMLSDLRESGSIEQDADVVAFVHREERYVHDESARKKVEGKAELIIAKQRNGPVGTVHLTWVGKWCRFEDAAPAEMEMDR